MANISEKIIGKINNHYDFLIKKYGYKNAGVLNYASYENQVLRFMVLAQIRNLEGCKILDVGCGLGDFSYYLKSKVKNFTYLGIDINKSMIDTARKKYPDFEFRQTDIFSLKGFGPDYVFASGLFGFNPGQGSDFKDYFSGTLEKMFEISLKGVGFNVLNARFHPGEGGEYFAMDLAELYNNCVALTPRLSLRHDYLDHDITVYLYK